MTIPTAQINNNATFEEGRALVSSIELFKKMKNGFIYPTGSKELGVSTNTSDYDFIVPYEYRQRWINAGESLNIKTEESNYNNGCIRLSY